MTENEVVTPNEEVEQKSGVPVWARVLGILLLVAIVVGAFLLFNRTPAAEDDSWAKVQAAGVLRVATSADYPPFSYTNQDFMIDGFDPALIRAIGEKLGVQVQITDYAFEGLADALQAGQADVAIAAISMTPERGTLVDFSNVYYVGKDGVLARADSGIERIDQIPQFGGKRVGVQRSSIYQAWAQKYLVGYQVIPQEMLFTYAEPEHAVNDLKLGRLDVVVMDLQPAVKTLSDPDLKLVGEGLNQQLLAIALPRGAETLKAQIDGALLALQNEGRVTQLAQTYLGLRPDDLIPPPTPEPTQAPCVDAMQFVEDLNYDDQDLTDFPVLDPGVAFQKGWRIKNTGSCEWSNAYFIKYVHGSDPAAQMGGQPTILKNVVEPGKTYDMFVDQFAPKVAGKYVGYWQMHDANGVPFGQTIWVAIEVRDTAPGEPTPTATVEASQTPPIPPTAEPTATEAPPTPEPTEEPGSDLRDVTWVLKEYRVNVEDEQLTEPIPEIDLTLNFEEDGNVSSFAGCNTFSGRYVTDGVQIIFRDFLGTQLACEQPEGVMEQEALYRQWLERSEEYRINQDGQLEFVIFVIENNQRVEKVMLRFYDQRVGP
jgi:polar amino acid transport system substrate-binding protein